MRHGFRQIMMVLLGGMVAISSQAQSALEVSPAAFDFGWAPQNATLVCEVWVHSSDEDTITITDIKTACGCLVVQPEPAQVTPGDSLSLLFYWQTRGFIGPRTISAYLYTGPDQQPRELTIGGNVVTENDSTASIHWWPRRLEFRPANRTHEKDIDQMITLINRTQTAMTVSLVEHGPELDLALPESIPAGQTVRVHATVADDHPGGDFESSFTLEFSGNENEPFRVSIPVVGGDFSFRPDFTTIRQ